MTAIYTKSPKGSREATGRTQDLPEDLRDLLKSCKGRFTVDAIAGAAAPDARAAIAEGLSRLIAQGYLREAPAAWPDGSGPATDAENEDEVADVGPDPDDAAGDDSGDAVSDASAAEPVVDEAAEKLRAEVARRRGERDESTAELVKQIDEAARIKAEEKAAREAMELARRAAEEEARRLAEEEARRAAEEAERRQAEEEARRQAAEKERREAEEARLRAEEERRRKAAEKKAREEALERARLEQEERDRQAIQERLRKRREKQRRMILPTMFGVLLPLLLAAAFLQLYSFEGKRAEFERTASELFGMPVKVGSARLWFAPGPQWRMNEVVLGSGSEAATIARIGINALWTSIAGAPGFESVRIDRAQLPPAMALKLLEQAGDASRLKSGDVTVNGLVFGSGQKDLPPLSLQAAFRDGRLVSVSGRGEDGEAGKLKFEMSREDQWQMTLEASNLKWILGADVPLTDITLVGRLAPGSLQLLEFASSLHSGELKGSGRLAWNEGWQLSGKLAARLIDASKVAKPWIREGSIGGNGSLLAIAPTPRELLPRASLSGSVAIDRGVLAAVDLDKVLQERGTGEETRFESLVGDFVMEARRLEFTSLSLTARDLKAGGTLTVDSNGTASGRIAIEARSGGSRRTANLRITGSLAAPNYQR